MTPEALPELAALGCAVLWAINALLLRAQADRIPPATMNATRCAVAGVLFLLLLPFDPHGGGGWRASAAELAALGGSVAVGIGVGVRVGVAVAGLGVGVRVGVEVGGVQSLLLSH